ncbi:MAG: hypothetical protein K2X87_05315, partial [Gemmataceae bacterium]|nr:hypothetical protein [Gemmataceae bacterium]
MRRLAFALALALAAVCAAGRSDAAVIPGLFNTGVDAAGVGLPDGTVGDPHYSLIIVPGGTTEILVRTSAGGFPIPPYFVGDETTSTWIGPNNDFILDGPEGTYVYRTTFDLTGLDPSTAVITGGWSTDNNGVDILINGVSTGYTTAFEQFAIGFADFTISDGFVDGINTLDFVVNNGGGPTALRVELSGTADPAAVPAPAGL